MSKVNLFKPNSKCNQIIAVLYTEKLPDNWRDLCDNSGLDGYISAEHNPDDIDKKPHRHLIIKDMHANHLSYEKCMSFISALNPSPLPPAILSGGLPGLKTFCKYTIHQTKASALKEQFSIQNPDIEPFEMPDNGIMEDGCLNIFHEDKGFYTFGTFDFIKYITLTTREKAEIRKELIDTQKTILLNYILDENISSLREVAIFARDNECLDALFSFHSLYNNLCYCNNLRKSKQTISKNPIVTIAYVQSILLKYYSSIDLDLLNWFYQANIDKLSKFNDKDIYKLWCQQIDMYNCEVRKKYYEQYKDWRGKNLSDDYSQGVVI